MYLYSLPHIFDIDKGHLPELVNPQSTELPDFNFQSLEVVSRCSETQLQVTENLCYL